MKVVVLCGGMGTRIREETEFRPKPMISIGNRPIIWHIMKTYSHYGYNNFVLCLGYKGDIIKDYFCHFKIIANDVKVTLGKENNMEILSNQSENNWEIILADTGEKALKGARLKRIEKYIDSDYFMVTYGDGVANVDINELVRFHKSHGRIATLTGVKPPSRFGEIEVEGNVIKEFTEKPQSYEGIINGGFFIFHRRIFDYLEDKEDCDLELGALEKLANEGELMVYRHDDFWACMDTYRDMEYLNRLWAQGKATWKVW